MIPKLVKQKHTADKAAAVTGQVVIYAVQVHANGANADIELCDALTDGSEDDLIYSALDSTTFFADYTNIGGVIFNTGLTVDVTGTAASVIIWTDVKQAAT